MRPPRTVCSCRGSGRGHRDRGESDQGSTERPLVQRKGREVSAGSVAELKSSVKKEFWLKTYLMTEYSMRQGTIESFVCVPVRKETKLVDGGRSLSVQGFFNASIPLVCPRS